MVCAGAAVAVIASVLPWVHQKGGLASPYNHVFDSYIVFRWPARIPVPNFLIPIECVIAAIIAFRTRQISLRWSAILGTTALLQTVIAFYRMLSYRPLPAFDVAQSLHVGTGMAFTALACLLVVGSALFPPAPAPTGLE